MRRPARHKTPTDQCVAYALKYTRWPIPAECAIMTQIEARLPMGEVIHLREFQKARERAVRGASTHRDLDAAVAVMRESLAAVAEHLRCAPPHEQSELLDRVEKLASMIRYGMRMLGEAQGSDGSATNGLRV
jgi:hypothetical protein